jgi:glycosyltransferase involved in cell wall biosynthesis
VIISKLEGVTDWIVTDGIDGLFVQPGDGDDLGRAIKEILGDDPLAESLGRKARRTVLERFSMKRVAEEYRELYKELIPSN